MNAYQIDNLFENVDIIYQECKKLTFYSQKEHPENKTINTFSNWPGTKTEDLGKVNKLLRYFIEKYLLLNNIIIKGNHREIRIYAHARFEQNKDWIHKDDGYKKACLIYLSPTNLNSGTYLFSDKKELINDFKFVQNRMICYSGDYNHMGYGHHGNNIDNCRLTLNIFIN